MAIQPPSDILLDVANAADPAAVRAATARLAALAADPAAANAGFSKALGAAARGGGASGAPAAAASPAPTPAALPSPVGGVHRDAAGRPDAYRKFEAVLLQSFVEAMLPKDSELFGDKQSADVYRSMMAEQLADQIASAGGIGIARSLEARHPPGAKPAGESAGGPAGRPADAPA